MTRKTVFSILLPLVFMTTLNAQNDELLFSPKGIAEVYITLSNGKTINDIKNKKYDADYVGKLAGTMIIKNSNLSTYDNSALYIGNILIEGRGNTTWGVPKKPYNIDLIMQDGSDNPKTLLDMPGGSAWCLLAFWHDRSLMRIPLAMYLGQQLNGIPWTAHLQYVELWVNDEYRGLYCLSEKVQRDDNRIVVKKLTNDAEDQIEPRVSGGYVLEASTPDKLNTEEQAVQFQVSDGINFSFKYPKAKNVTSEQRQWILNYLNEFETVIYDYNKSEDPVNGFRKYVNIPGFIDWTILHELSKGCDNLFHASVFVQKDRNDKLSMTAPWDFDLSFGNSGVYTEAGDWVRTHRWFYRLYLDADYATQYNNRYDEFQTLFKKIPAILQANYQWLEESGALDREIKKWPQILQEYTSQDGLATAKGYKAHVEYLSEWTMSRNNWCYIALGMNNQEKGDRMKTIQQVIRIMNPESMQAGTSFNVKVMKSDDNNNTYTYSWNDEPFTTAFSQLISQKGKYWVKIKDQWGNVSLASDTLYFGVPAPATIDKININPVISFNNPVQNILHLNYYAPQNSGLQLQIVNLNGKKLIENNVSLKSGNNSLEIPVSGLDPGIYVLRLLSENSIVSKKIIVK